MAAEDNDLERLIKMLGMTQTSNDNQNSVAMRKANDLATRLGGWEAILRGKVQVRIIADPFANIQMPSSPVSTRRPAPPDRPEPPKPNPPPTSWHPTSRPMRPAPSTVPPRAQGARTSADPRVNLDNIFGSGPSSGNVSQQKSRVRQNAYAGTCVQCGNEVKPHEGTAFQRPGGQRWYTEHLPGRCPPKRKRHNAFTSDDLQPF